MKMAQPDGKKIFFENLSGAGKAIAVLTSGGDAQGKVWKDNFTDMFSVDRPAEGEHTLHLCDAGPSVKWRDFHQTLRSSKKHHS